ncbi:MAG: hypothetical protein SFY92_02430 [Verrucomicrobiae bacterium]|nr:hypothetical protein [Verrucomicrobiae bacterium]
MKHILSLKLQKNWTAFYREFSTSLRNESNEGQETFAFDLPMDTRHLMFLHGKVPDPRLSDNSRQSDWVAAKEWWFETKFAGPVLKSGERATLRLRGVDQLAEFFVNGTHVGSSESFNQVHYLDVTAPLTPGENILSIRLWSCDPRDIQSPDEAAKNRLGNDAANMNMGMAGLFKATPQSLKSRMLYGGDQNPFMLSCGLAEVPELIVSRGGCIHFIRSEYAFDADFKTVSGVFWVHGSFEGEFKYQLRLEPVNFHGASLDWEGTAVPDTSGMASIPFNQIPVKSWMPFDLGHPHCYTLSLRTGGQEVRQVTGFRQVERRCNTTFRNSPAPSVFDWHPYENQSYGQESYKGYDVIREGGDAGWPEKPREGDYNFDHYINGQKVYVKGGSTVPTTLFWSDWSGDHLRNLMRRARESNNNTLRVWGGGYLSGEEFFEEASLLGVMISQDFLNFAPGTDKSLQQQQRLEREFFNVILQMNMHPSVVIMNGGNELFQFGDQNRPLDPIFQIMDRLMKRWGRNQYFHRSCPINPEVHGPWHVDLDHQGRYHSIKTPFNSECGVTAAASLKSLKKALRPEELAEVSGPVWSHRMPDRGYYAIMERYCDWFTPLKTARPEDFVRYTQWIQATGYQYIAEEFRRQKPHSSGFTTWEFNEPWVDFNWGIIDSNLVPKHSFYTFKRACATRLISARYTSYLYAEGSDFRADVFYSLEGNQWSAIECEAVAVDSTGKSLGHWTFRGKTNGDSVCLGSVSFPVPSRPAFFLKLRGKTSDGEPLENDYAFSVIPGTSSPGGRILFLSGGLYESNVIHEYFKAAHFTLEAREVSPVCPLDTGRLDLSRYDAVVLGPIFNPIRSLGLDFFKKIRDAVENRGLGLVYFGFNTSAYVSGAYEVDGLRGSALEEMLPFGFADNHYSNSDEHNRSWSIQEKDDSQVVGVPWDVQSSGFKKVCEHPIWKDVDMSQPPGLAIRVQTTFREMNDVIGIEGSQPVLGVRHLGKGRVVAFAGPYGGHNFSQTPFRRWNSAHQLLVNLLEYAATGHVTGGLAVDQPMKGLTQLDPCTLEVLVTARSEGAGMAEWTVEVVNGGTVPALYFTVVNDSMAEGDDFDFSVSDNYCLLLPGQSKTLQVCARARTGKSLPAGLKIDWEAWNR